MGKRDAGRFSNYMSGAPNRRSGRAEHHHLYGPGTAAYGSWYVVGLLTPRDPNVPFAYDPYDGDAGTIDP